MTIDEAIEQFKEDAKYNMDYLDFEFAKENEQVAEWLEELKAYKGSDDCPNIYKIGYQDGIVDGIKQGRQDANDEIKKWKSEIISEFAKYDATCADEIYRKGRNYSIGEYSNNAHSRILYDLTDIMADLNEKEIKSHDDIDEWLKVWKRKVIRMIWHSMCEVRFEIEQKMKEDSKK